MNDQKIIELYFSRSEQAIRETDLQYGSYCRTIAMNILTDQMDSEECVNDAFLHTWHAIPPTRPNSLKAFVARITRNLSLTRLAARTAQKRSGGQTTVPLDELTDLFDEKQSVDAQMDEAVLRELLNRYIRKLSKEKRVVFVARYWYCYPITEIAGKLQLSESKVKTILFRIRKDLKNFLEKEGVRV